MTRFPVFYGWIVFHWIYVPHLIYLFIRWWALLGCFHILAIVNNAAMNIRMHISFQISVFVFFGQICRSGVAGSYGSSSFNFLRNCHNVFHSGCTNLHSHQLCMRVPFSTHPHWHLLFLVFLIIAILTGVRWHVTVVSIWIPLTISDVEHLSMGLLATCMSSLENM